MSRFVEALILAAILSASQAQNNFEGKYKLAGKENFSEYLKALDVPFLLRVAANSLKPTVTLSRSCPTDAAPVSSPGCTWTLVEDIRVQKLQLNFKLGEKVQFTTLDKRSVESVFSVVGEDTLKEDQEGQVHTTVERMFTRSGMEVKLVAKGVTASASYTRI